MIVGLLVGAILLLFFGLGITSLTNWDEAWLAAVARSMVERGDYLVGFWNGEPWFYEPPLVTWALAVLMKVGLTSEFWLRLPIAAAGVGIVYLVYLLGKLLFRSSLVGFLSALVLLSNIEFLFRARQINVYVPLTFFLLLALYAAYRSLTSKKRRWIFLAFGTVGVAFLTARVTAFLALPALVVVLWPKLAKKESRRWLMMAALLGIVVFGWWYAAAYWQYGATFFQKYFLGYTLTKVTTTNPGTGADWLFYILALKRAFKLWATVLPFALLWSFWRAKQQPKILLGILTYIFSFLVILTVAPNKASWFLLPAYPLLALVIGAFLSWAGRLFKQPTLVLIGCVSVFALQVYWWRSDFIVPETTAHQALMAQKAKVLTSPDETIYLDDDYLPVAVFYSGRQVRPLRFNRIVDESWREIDLPSESFVLSNTETVENLKERSRLPLTQIDKVADLLLFRVE